MIFLSVIFYNYPIFLYFFTPTMLFNQIKAPKMAVPGASTIIDFKILQAKDQVFPKRTPGVLMT